MTPILKEGRSSWIGRLSDGGMVRGIELQTGIALRILDRTNGGRSKKDSAPRIKRRINRNRWISIENCGNSLFSWQMTTH